MIENPVPVQASHSGGHHMALANIEQRLQVLYDGEASLKTDLNEHRFTVVLQYPLGQEA